MRQGEEPENQQPARKEAEASSRAADKAQAGQSIPDEAPPATGANEAADTVDFAAIDVAATASAPVDQAAVRELDAKFNDEPRRISQAHRRLRNTAFMVFGGLCVAFLIALLCLLIDLFSLDSPLLYVFAKMKVDWHAWLIVAIALVIFAAVPLSLAMALMRMIANRTEADEKSDYAIKTPQLEAIKIMADTIKTLGGR